MPKLHVRKSPHRLRRVFLFVGVPTVSLCVTFILLYVFIPVRYDAPSRISVPIEVVLPPPVEVQTSPPVRLVIPIITIDTTIKPVGLTNDGNMAIDDSMDDVAWYQLGAKPGEKGSAVIAGHYGWKNGKSSIFNNIHTLRQGDKVSTYDELGKVVNFVVREIRTYNPEADATEVFKSTDNKAHLNLVTCGGSWVKAQDSYSDRLVVFTDLE